MSDPLRQQRLQIASRPGEAHRVPLAGKPFPDSPQIGGIGVVDGDYQGFPRRYHLFR
jgi:hypothetical protein